MKFTVNWAFRHNGKAYEAGDTFDKMSEKEARAAGLCPGVLSPAPQASSKTSSKTDGNDDKVDATNAAVDLAAEHDIDLADVEGSGKEGRIILSDVEALVNDASTEEE